MSGRGRGRSNGRGNRSAARGGNNNGNKKPYNNGQGNNYKPTKKTLSDYIYYLGSAKQAANYEVTTDYLLNHIKKTFVFGNDIASALYDKTPYNVDQHKPSLKFSTSKNDDQKAAENEQFKIEFKAEYDAYMKRKQTYESNYNKAYALLWEQCAKGMQSKIESRTDFKIIKDDPITLLKAIQQHALNNQEQRYEMSIILDAIKTIINLKQRK